MNATDTDLTDVLPPSEPEDTAPVDVAPDSKPRRPTTRAGRAAAREARKAAAASNDSKPKTTKTAPRKATLENRLAASLSSLGTAVLAGGAATGSQALQADGLVVIQSSADMAAAINKVADNDPRVKAALEKMLTAGVWGGLVATMVPVALAIAGNHGLIPPGVAAMMAGNPQPVPEQAAA
jgi:hypothetical protein